jgi:7-cyano-7-deazaguanine reductase
MSIVDEIDLPLGKVTTYNAKYDPNLLCAVPRSLNRNEWSESSLSEMFGWDIWYGFEVNYINSKDNPIQARMQVKLPASSANLVESKSFKLYLYALRDTKFSSLKSLEKLIENDLSTCIGAEVEVSLSISKEWPLSSSLPGHNIDNINIETNVYLPDPSLLMCTDEDGTYEINSNLFKSNCLITNQPDWASIYIRYVGKKLDYASLLKYLASFRSHQGFHEHCVEKIYFDLLSLNKFKELTVYAQYTRRGGLAIAPLRSNITDTYNFPLLWRT